MLTHASPKMRLLLIKSDVKDPGKFKHSGKHYLLNGRWHALHHDKPVPKVAAVAAHPHAAGAPVQGGVFSEDEWKQIVAQFKLDISPDNTNAKDVIKKLNTLKHLAETGDVTGLLGMQFGTNSYSKHKLVPLANYILGQLGSTHTVSAGQKAGEHAAVQGAPEASAPAAPSPVAEQGPKNGDTKEGADGQQLVFKDGRWHKVVAADEHGELPPALVPVDDNPEDAPPAAEASALSMPAFQEGKTVTGVIAYYEKVAQHVMDLAAAGDVAALEQMKADGLKPNHKGKVSNTWAGKTPNSKLLLAMHAQALEHAKGGAKPSDVKPADLPSVGTVTEPAASSGQAQPIESAKDEALQAAVDHLKEDAKQGDLPAAEKKEDAALVQKLEAAQGVSGAGNMNYEQFKQQMQSLLSQAHKYKPGQIGFNDYSAKMAELADKYPEFDAKLDEESANQPAATLAAKEPRLVLPKKAREAVPATAPAASSKLDQIPWDAQLLPADKSNAKSHNKQVEKIKAMAYAGDVAGLEAFKAGSNTYGKKQNLLAQTALAALKEGGTPAAAQPAPAPAAEPSLAETFAEMDKKELYTQIEAMAKEKIFADPAGKADVIAALNDAGLKGLAKMIDKETPVSGAPKSLAGKPAYDHIAQQLKAGGFADTAAKEWEAANPGAWDELNEALTSHGYEHLATFGPVVSKPDDGPHEGDTKQGADGTLVFKNGRWHKQEQPQAAQPAATGVDAVQVPDFASLSPGKWGEAYQKVAEHLKQLVATGGIDALKGVVINHQDGKFTVKAAGYNLKKVGPDGTSDPLAEARRKAMHKFITELKAAAGKPKKASKPKAAPAAAPAPAAAAPTIESMDTWTQTGQQGGSNPGGRFKDPDGVEWYCKFPADEDMAKAEVLAAKLYAALGVAGQDAKLVTKGGKVGIASKWTTVSKASSPAALAKVDGVAAGFGADAWLANWDVVGLGYDNLQIGADGKAHRVDAGGSLMYRAQGGKKAFGNTVTEIDSLRDAKINPQAAAVFGGMTDADITASVAKVLALPDASIRAICYQYGPGSEADRKALAETLIARKADLAAKFPKAAKPKKKRLDPNNLPVDASQLPKRHDFSNWNGPSKGLSSKPHVNAANAAVEQEIVELAKTGNLTKLKDFHFHEIDKDTGNATGKLIPIKNHPSKHVVQFHADVVQLLDELANPPEPLKIFAETDVPTLDALAAAFPPKPFGTTVDSVKSNEKLGFWVVLGGASGVEKFKPKKVMDYSKAAIDAAYQKYKDAKPLAKHFINSVQASGSYNDLFRNGKEADGHGNKLTDVAKAALEQATTMPEGTSVYRWQNMSDDMVKKIMSAPDGTVFQATGPMCTSYSPTATSGFGQHRVIVRYAKGAKAVESFGSGAFKGEKEVTTLPNSRFVILSKKMVPNEKNAGKQRLELEVLMLPPDLGIADAVV